MQAPRTPYESVRRLIEKEYGKPIEEIFDCKETSHLTNALNRI